MPRRISDHLHPELAVRVSSPGAYQGTYLDTQHREVEKLIENIRNNSQTPEQQRKQLDLVRRLNEIHRESRPGDAQVEARIQSFELAFRMQTEAAEVFDLNREPAATRALYGDERPTAANCSSRAGFWSTASASSRSTAGPTSPGTTTTTSRPSTADWPANGTSPIAAFLSDLKRRGMLDDTLVIWGGEFGRTPTVELPTPGSNQGKQNGRDHNHYGFSMWMAGGGSRGGHVHGRTDDAGFAAVEDKVHVHDLHATILHLLGFDHEKLTYRYAGRDFRLTDVHGNVVKSLLA